MAEKFLYVGLDRDRRRQNVDLANRLAAAETGDGFGFKVNLDHALMWGESYVKEIVAAGRDVFVDLKMNNGPRTMGNIMNWLGELGVSLTNAWAHSEANLAGTLSAIERSDNVPRVFGVTFYTRWDEAYARKHHGMSLPALIGHWSRVAVENGADGIILPANHLEAVGDLETPKLCPGIRMLGDAGAGEQRQVGSPYDAALRGADILVVGSPIHSAARPAEALRTYLDEIGRAAAELQAGEA